jgi:hypothetical protein
VPQRFPEAARRYAEAVALAEAHVGPTHLSLGTHLFNFGASRLQAGSAAEAAGLLRRAADIFAAHDAALTVSDRHTWQVAREQLALAER